MLKISIILLSIFLVFAVGIALNCYLTHTESKSCLATIGLSKYSPDNSKEAVIYDYKCDIEVGYATQVSIIKKGQKLPEAPGNAYSASGGMIRGHWHGPYVEVEWKSNNILIVRSVEGAKNKTAVSNISNVKIIYETLILNSANQSFQPTANAAG